MKKTLKSCMFAAFASATLSLFAAEPYNGQMVPGEYEISTFTQLTNFTEKVRSYDYAGSTITLVSDIDCGGRRILPGNRVNPATFCGTFDGGGHKIERILNQIFIVDPDSHYGSALFDIVKNGAVIRNLTLEGEVYVSQSDDIEDIAVFAAHAQGANAATLENCHFIGEMVVRNSNCHAAAFVGRALRGASDSQDATVVTLTNCTADAAINATNSTQSAGMLVAQGEGVVAVDCSATGVLAGKGTLGGLAGELDHATLTRCSFNGELQRTWNSTAINGGVAGVTKGESSFFDCSSACTVDGYAGGFVGLATGSETFSNCTAVVSGSAQGGFAAHVSSSEAAFIDCSSRAAGSVDFGFVGAVARSLYGAVGTNHFTRCSFRDSSANTAGFAGTVNFGVFTDCIVSNVSADVAGFAQIVTNGTFMGCSVLGGSATNGFVESAGVGNVFTQCTVLDAKVVNGFVGGVNPGGATAEENVFRRCRVRGYFSNASGVCNGFAGELNSGAVVEDCLAHGVATDETGELYGFAGTIGGGVTVLRSVGAVLPPKSEPRGAGFAGVVASGAAISDCYAVYAPLAAARRADADAANGVQGGFARYFDGTAERCFACKPIPEGSAGVGGCGTFCGAHGNAWHFTDCYAPFMATIHSGGDMELNGIELRTAEQFADAANFPNYDFANVWRAPASAPGVGAASSPYLSASTDADTNLWTFVAVNGYGSVLVNGEEPAEAYPPGSVLTIKAVPGEGALFTGWIGDGIADPAALETTCTVGNAGVIYATFDCEAYTGQKEPGHYLILTYDQLVNFMKNVRTYSYSGSIIFLADDIDCGGNSFMPARADALSSFGGTFDGRGKRIFNFRNSVAQKGAITGGAFFDVIAPGAFVKNLTLEGAIDIADSTCTNAAVFATYAYANQIQGYPTIDNCRFIGSISNTLGAAVFVGNAYRLPYTPVDTPSVLLTNCTANASVFSATNVNALAGGLVAKGEGVFAVDCSFVGTLEGGGTLGGLVGQAENSTFANCTFSGGMSGGYQTNYVSSVSIGGCGAVVGIASNSTFRACSAEADIDWDFPAQRNVNSYLANFVAAGGAAGVTMGTSTFDGCSFNGTVQSVNGYAAGFVGWTAGRELFTNCTAVAALNPTGSVQEVAIGGFAGSVSSTDAAFIDCSATATGVLSGFFDVQHMCLLANKIGTNFFTRCSVVGTSAADAGFAGNAAKAVFRDCAVRGGEMFTGFVKESGYGCEYTDCLVTGATVNVGFVYNTSGTNTFSRCRAGCLYGFDTGGGASLPERGYWGFAAYLNNDAVVGACAAYGAVSAEYFGFVDEPQYGNGLFARAINGGATVRNSIGAVMQTMAAVVDERFQLMIDDDAHTNNCWSLFKAGVPANLSYAKDPDGKFWTLPVVVAGQGTILVDNQAPAASYAKDSVHTIRAIPASGYEFSHWVGLGYGDVDSAETTYTAGNIGAIAAAFAKKIGTPEEFMAVTQNSTVPYVLAGDIDLTSVVGDGVSKSLFGDYTGRFLGGGHAIRGVRFIDRKDEGNWTRAALFKSLSPGADVRDLTVEVTATNRHAIIAGLALDIKDHTFVTNCTVSVDFRSGDDYDWYYATEYYGIASNVVGGAIKIMDCTVSGTLDASRSAAGLFGGVELRSGEIARCAVFGAISATAPNGVASGFANRIRAGYGYGGGATVREIVTAGTVRGNVTGAGIAAEIAYAYNDATFRDMYSTAEVRAHTGYGVAAGVARTISSVDGFGSTLSNVWFGGTARAGYRQNYGFAETVNFVELENCAYVSWPASGGTSHRASASEEAAGAISCIPPESRLQRSSWTGYDFANVWSMMEGTTTPYFAWSLASGKFRIFAERARGATITHQKLALPGANVAATAEIEPESNAFFVRWDGAPGYADRDIASTTFPADNHRTANVVWGRNISAPEQLQAVSDDLSGIYRVVADFDMGAFGFMPIGAFYYPATEHYENCDGFFPFFGDFDGGGHAISNLVAYHTYETYGSLSSFGGLFSRLREASVADVRLVGPRVVLFGTSGSLAGEIISSTVSNFTAVGASVYGGQNFDKGYSGGLAGRLADSTVYHSFAAGYVGEYDSGGFVGFVTNSVISECFASGAVKGSGLVSAASGGFAGRVAAGTRISDCYTISEVEGVCGGFAGRVEGNDVTIERCYSAGIVEGASSGAFLGSVSGSPSISDCIRRHYDIYSKKSIADVGSTDHPGIVSLLADEMRAVTNFTAFLDTGLWAQTDGQTHPYFPWALEGDKMPVVSMMVGRINSFSSPTYLGYAKFSKMASAAPGGSAPVSADSALIDFEVKESRTFIFWKGLSDDTDHPCASSTDVKADNFRTAMAQYGMRIGKDEDLYSLTNYPSGTFGLDANVRMPEKWKPLGSSSGDPIFSGKIFGAGHTISFSGSTNLFQKVGSATFRGINLNGEMSGTSSDFGLLAGVVEGTVTVQDCDVRVTIPRRADVSFNNACIGGFFGDVTSGSVKFERCSASGQFEFVSYSGGFVGRIKSGSGTFIDCSSSVGLKSNTGSGNGGIVGRIESGSASFLRCSASGDIEGQDDLGGLVGYSAGRIQCEDSHASGSVSGTYVYTVGGLIGGLGSNASESSFQNCTASGKVSNSYSDGAAGGFIGWIASGAANVMFADSSASGDVATRSRAGGFVGMTSGASAVFTNCVASGFVSGRGRLGGFVGVSNGAGTRFVDCEASGNVSIVDGNGWYDGGFVGACRDASYEYCRAFGSVSAGDQRQAGGFAGAVEGADSFYRCMAAGPVKGGNYLGGFGGYFTGANAQVKECFALGDVTGCSGNVGGFVGRVDKITTFLDSYSLGNVRGPSYPVGGFVGNAESVSGMSFVRCYAAGTARGTYTEIGAFAGNLYTNYVTVGNCAARVGGDAALVAGVVPTNALGRSYGISTGCDGVTTLGREGFLQRSNFAAFHEATGSGGDPIWAQVDGVTQPYLAWSAKDGKLSVYAVIAGSKTRGGSISGAGAYEPGTEVSITALADSERFFSGWTGTAQYDDPNDFNTTLTLDNHRAATTQFGRFVNDADELAAITDELDGVFGLASDIDLSDRAWSSIGITDSLAFTGKFFGHGYHISNLWCTNKVNNGTGDIGLFGIAYNATFDGVSVSGMVQGTSDVGGLVGDANGVLITNCVTMVELFPRMETSNNGPFGGLVGNAYASVIVNCRADGCVIGEGRIGGLVGVAGNCTRIFNCAARGDVRNANTINGVTGGFVGLNKRPYSGTGTDELAPSISNCWCSGTVWGSAAGSYGAFAGSGSSGTMVDCAVVDNRMAKRLHCGDIRDFSCKVLNEAEVAERSVGWPERMERDLSGAKHISTAEELSAIADDLYGIYILDRDINMRGATWKPVGDYNKPFSGEFYGNNHRIRNFVVDGVAGEREGGFFGCVAGRVKGLRLKGTISSTNSTYSSCAGGFAGYVLKGSLIEDCSFEGDVTGHNESVGGFVGNIDGPSLVAGCCATGAVRKITVPNGGNRGTGGFVGNVGSGYDYPRVTDCYSLCSVDSDASWKVGGFVGYFNTAYGQIYTSYCSGSVTNTVAYRGAFAGEFSSHAFVTNSYYNSDVADGRLAVGVNGTGSNARAGITPLSAEEMKHAANFANFDFANTWGIVEGETTPYLLALYVSKTGYELWLDENGIGGDPEPEEIGNGIPYGFRYVFDIPMDKGPGDFAPPLFHIAFGADGKPYVKLPEQVNDEGVTIEVLASTDLEDFGKEDTSEWSHRVVMRLDENGYYRPAKYLDDPTTYVWPNAMFFAWHLVVE